MSIIILTSEDDVSTNKVIEWLLHWKKDFIRINNSLSVNDYSIGDENNGSLKVDNREFHINEIKSYWHRRNNFQINHPKLIFEHDLFSAHLKSHLNAELAKLNYSIHYDFNKKKKIGNIFSVEPNKLIVLKKAQEKGLKIPDTLVTSNKESLNLFRRKKGDIICKAISEAILFADIEIGGIYNYTNILDDIVYEQLPDIFSVTLFQEKIDKAYELRIFYLHGKFYSMAIFSQSDAQTNVDFRKYNYKKPNRTVPYKLPKSIEIQLSELMNDLQLDTGSIDMAVTKEGHFVFFEVNPAGQFGMTSYPCNYYIERIIAKFLCCEED